MNDSNFKNIFKQLSIYSFFSILSKSVSFLLLPLYTRYLAPDDYGTLELVEITASIFEIFASVGIGFAVFKFYHKYETQEEKGRVVSSAITASLLLHLVFALVGLLFSKSLSVLIFESAQYQGYFILIFFRIVMGGAISIAADYLRVINRTQLYGWYSLSRLLLGAALNVLFLVTLKMGVQGVLLSNIISQLGIGIPLIAYIYSRLGFRFDVGKLIPMFRYGMPFIAVLIGQLVINFADRFFLQRYSTLTEVGIYSLGYKMGFMVNFLVLTPFLLMWEGKMFEIEKQSNAKATYTRILTYFVGALSFVALIFTVLIDEILYVMTTPAYYTAATIVPLIACAYICNGLQSFFRLGMLIESKTSIIGRNTLLQSILSIGLYFIAIRFWGALGAAIATVLSFMGVFIANFIFSQSLYPIHLEFKRLLRVGLAAFVIVIIKFFLPEANFLFKLILKIGLLLSFPLILILTGFLNDEEKALIKKIDARLPQRIQCLSFLTHRHAKSSSNKLK